MNKNDYPSLSRTQPFGGRSNDAGKLGSFVFTRASLNRVCMKAFTLAAAVAGALYIFNAIDTAINGDDILGNNNNNRQNGRR